MSNNLAQEITDLYAHDDQLAIDDIYVHGENSVHYGQWLPSHNVTLNALATAVHDSTVTARHGNIDITNLLHSLYTNGYETEDIAARISVPTELVVREALGSPDDAGLFVEFERFARSGWDGTSAQLQDRFGLSADKTAGWLALLGLKTIVQKNRLSGGAGQFSGETIDTIRSMREAGVSYTVIAETVGAKRNTVIGVCRRKGFAPTNVSVVA